MNVNVRGKDMKTIRKTFIGIYGFWILENLQRFIDNEYIKYFVFISMAGLIMWSILNLELNVREAKKLYKEGDSETLRRNMKVIKFGLIPFFVINFLVNAGIAILLLIMFAPVALFYSLFMTLVTFLVLICSSAYGIAYIKLLQDEGKVSKNERTLHIILQICFVLDMLDTAYLNIKYRK